MLRVCLIERDDQRVAELSGGFDVSGMKPSSERQSSGLNDGSECQAARCENETVYPASRRPPEHDRRDRSQHRHDRSGRGHRSGHEDVRHPPPACDCAGKREHQARGDEERVASRHSDRLPCRERNERTQLGLSCREDPTAYADHPAMFEILPLFDGQRLFQRRNAAASALVFQ